MRCIGILFTNIIFACFTRHLYNLYHYETILYMFGAIAGVFTTIAYFWDDLK